ncbi:MAG: transposase family protein [Flavobacteriales bacterium]|nr:transposase family protein [Flavobacteriales bacterium]
MLDGYYIGPKKAHRLMQQQDLLAPRRKAAKRTYVKYRVVTPERPLHVLEMDIKSKWVTGERRSGYILTILDTFTRQALHWQAGLCMTQHQITQAWDQVIKHHLQPADLLSKKLHVEVRSDNGPQFIASMVQGYFKTNHLDQVFTHPYTPQENGHIESFHAILGAYLDRHTIWNLDQLLEVLSRSTQATTGSASMAPPLTSGPTSLSRLGIADLSSARWTAAIASSSSC